MRYTIWIAAVLALAAAPAARAIDAYSAGATYAPPLPVVTGGPACSVEPAAVDAGCGLAADDSCLGLRMEYLLWWGRGQNLPPTFTTSPAGTPQAEAGVLGFADTEVLFGDETVGGSLRSGARITLDYLLPGDCDRRLVGRLYFLEDGRDTFAGSPASGGILARPFFNLQTGGQDSLLIAFPGIADGDAAAFAQTRNDFLGSDLYLQQRICDEGCYTLDWLAGYQFARLDDSLFISSATTSIDPLGLVPVGTRLDVTDIFRTQNEFHGVSLGLVGVQRSGCWRLEWLAKIAVGNVHQTSIVRGSTIATEPNLAPVTSSGGLLALGTNSGELSRDEFAFIPEINLNLGYQINDGWSAMIGYSFLYFSDVAVAGGQLDPVANLSQIGGPLVGDARPRAQLNDTDYWLQGLSLGAEYRW